MFHSIYLFVYRNIYLFVAEVFVCLQKFLLHILTLYSSTLGCDQSSNNPKFNHSHFETDHYLRLSNVNMEILLMGKTHSLALPLILRKPSKHRKLPQQGLGSGVDFGFCNKVFQVSELLNELIFLWKFANKVYKNQFFKNITLSLVLHNNKYL